ncbi:GntR family transcriptional regulator [Pseudonocardia sp.]|uniref:GntR family transcriptional regulator n=1 Tax=Pseudonocardia sp. TaxID=60912 RepID=UPI0031FD6132
MWQQLRADLFARIENGALSPGDPLPAETALAEAYGVNRLTVRRALADLARVGVVRTEHGVGSFVASQPVRHRIDDGQVSLLESMAKDGRTVRQLVIGARRVDPSSSEAPPSDPPPGRPPVPPPRSDGHAVLAGPHATEYHFPDFLGAVMEYRYIRWVDELPWSVSFAAIPAALAPQSWNGATSLFAAMSTAHGVHVRRDERCFSAVPANPEDASWLEVQVGTPLLLLRGTNSNERGQAVAHIVHRIRGDRAEYAMRVPH